MLPLVPPEALRLPPALPHENSQSVFVLLSLSAPPSVTSPPEESVQAARGATVTFTCQAVGVPVPIITWRLNWGHIPASARWDWWPIPFFSRCR